MELSIQERLKNLHVDRDLTLEQAAMAFICKRSVRTMESYQRKKRSV